MHIIICGMGQVGFSIADHLAQSNDVTVIDSSGERVQRVVDSCNARGLTGIPSHPDILEQAGASGADMIIAVTESDEINMIACQVAHSIYNTPIKIARIRARAYLNPIVGDLYSPDNVPIDHIISPEVEVSDAVSRRLDIPGAFDVASMGEERLRIVGVRCFESCPILGRPLRDLTGIFEGLSVTIVAILRGNEVIVSRDGSAQMEEGDRVYFVCDKEHMTRAMASFGHEEPASRKVLIAGGGTVGRMVAQNVVSGIDGSSCVVIESSKESAEAAAHEISENIVLHGDALDPEILKEGGVEDADTFVALTNDDEVNVLAALSAKRFGAEHTVALVNVPSFVPLISTLGVDSVINPPAITVSSILKHVRRGGVSDIYTIVEDQGEFIEVKALASSPLVGQALRTVKLPPHIVIGAIVRGEEIIVPRGDTVIEPDDKVILFATRQAVVEVEKLLSVRPNFF